jgi:3-isopropylmalate dehydrogenase
VLSLVRPDATYTEAAVGGAALAQGLSALPDETRALCDRSDAILFGSVGLPEYEGKPLRERPELALFLLRREYELYANLRPVRVFAGLEDASSLRPELVRGLDLVVVRELTGGIYFGQPKEQRRVDGVDEAVDTMIYRAPEIERIARTAFELARARRKTLTSVDKQNILETSRLWRRVVESVARDYPDVTLTHLLVDNAAMQLVRRPRDFDVIVTENMFGDILSDEAAILTGSIGTLPSASLGPSTSLRTGTRERPGGRFGLYEPIGGTAPDIAGKNVANPTAAILSAAMLLRHSLGDAENAARIERAVDRAYADGLRTAELASGDAALSTQAFTEAVIARL